MTPGPALVYQSLHVRERLGNREAALRRIERGRKERERDLIAGPRLPAERGLGPVEPLAMVLDDLSRPCSRVSDRLAVSRQRQPGRERDRTLEGRQVLAQGIRSGLGIQADRRRDVRQEVIAGDEHAVAKEAEVAVGVAGELDHFPAVDLLAFADFLGVARVVDERLGGAPLLEHLVGDLGRHAVPPEPGRDSLRPIGASPNLLALRVVERALEHLSAGDAARDLSAPDMVGMEVRDQDALDRPVQLGDKQLLQAGQAEAGVDEQPAGLALDDVAVDVPRRKRERDREPADAWGDLLHRFILVYEHMFYTAEVRVEYREEPCKVALNRVRGMPFNWSLNPYMGCVHRCTFCYVRAFERRAERPYGDRYGQSIRVKINVAEVLRRELARESWQHEPVAVGAATDPYQPAEGRYRLTRACIEAFAEAHTPFSLITRGPLIVRDIDVLRQAAARAEVSVNFSVPTLDERVWRTTEPGTAPPRQRLRALKALVDAGIKAGVGMAPILPGISDKPELLREVVLAAREAGATHLWTSLLHLRPGTREHFLEHLAEDWPEQAERYERLYARGAYLKKDAAAPIQGQVAELRREFGIADRRPVRLAPPAEPKQLALAV